MVVGAVAAASPVPPAVPTVCVAAVSRRVGGRGNGRGLPAAAPPTVGHCHVGGCVPSAPRAPLQETISANAVDVSPQRECLLRECRT